ncbi:MAG: hypothetical protein ACRED4_06080 [Brevundimonas sp.]
MSPAVGVHTDSSSAVAALMPSLRPLNRLEALGWAFLAQEVLSLSAGEARALQKLACERPGQVVSNADLRRCLSKALPCTRDARLAVSTRLARVRGALVDVGFDRTVVENIERVGYRIARAEARQVRTLIEHGGLA